MTRTLHRFPPTLYYGNVNYTESFKDRELCVLVHAWNPALWKCRQEDCELEGVLEYIGRKSNGSRKMGQRLKALASWACKGHRCD